LAFFYKIYCTGIDSITDHVIIKASATTLMTKQKDKTMTRIQKERIAIRLSVAFIESVNLLGKNSMKFTAFSEQWVARQFDCEMITNRQWDWITKRAKQMVLTQ
jgi:hypothetical protein